MKAQQIKESLYQGPPQRKDRGNGVSLLKKYLSRPGLVPLFCILLMLCGSFGIFALSTQSAYNSQEVAIPVEASKRQLRGSLLLPSLDSEKPLPGVVLVHGVIVNRQYMSYFAKSLAQMGLAVLSLDLGGYGESDPRPESEADNLADAQAAIAWLRQFPGIDNSRIALGGHSMGGTTVIQALEEDPSLKGGVVLGMAPETKPSEKLPLWFGIGLYDAFHPPSQMRQKLANGTTQTLNTRLVISGFSSHQTEMQDPYLLAEASNWLGERLNLSNKSATHHEFWREIWSELYFYGWIGLLLTLLWKPEHGWGELVLLTFGLGALLLLGQFHLIAPLHSAKLCLLMLLLIHLRKTFTAKAHAHWQRIGILTGSFWLSYQAVALIDTLPEYYKNPAQVLAIPFFLFQELRVLPLTSLQSLLPVFFEAYSQSVQPAGPLAVILALEWFKPGVISQAVFIAETALSERLLNPQTDKKKPPKPWVLGGLFAGLSILLGALLWQRAESGFLHAGALKMLWQQGLFKWLPTCVGGFFLARWGLMKTCPRDDSNVRPTI
ncbi:hypothetical protein COW36_12025 [bacterium (Candidatus Blackallbacteria) CG17_big_fil_post_rev_8_21_14_2_50_48_46]|uniref:Serine aminopeptidase S33 domain-containing protein n=1 Tax=bacterium (Candidatus Blackallbacteria) CG17_big_fil_post_rev_8_21_14_2_50_48_46 TaxID=2014261 RepID=A0A2M7G4C0_9BACT|nr:MAG: hypothetical protein COW64_03235 [bacterium (Candidatus Blackallbacteria) CG18_big_fil_WC_8_21_14_2_50_49_26]PIW16725.1 MAG: hypothetical protein COW36_12025 [bacterium (Candidatus Blackallbacteria) CG17_big_fil_post_rev_8_21_14_2_50_48_46]PIW46231.1 MAG: hypothetical protein COW20_17290 [bacterium (Candidatus Blackallbacteria) CG13_big_fil_rev_8_21_14_2_50_49_14]